MLEDDTLLIFVALLIYLDGWSVGVSDTWVWVVVLSYAYLFNERRLITPVVSILFLEQFGDIHSCRYIWIETLSVYPRWRSCSSLD